MKKPIVFIAALVGACVIGALMQREVYRHSEQIAEAIGQTDVVQHIVETEVFRNLEQWADDTFNPPDSLADQGVDSSLGEYPTAKAVPGMPGFVTSPYTPNQGPVDVRGFPPGTEVKDPYTNKIYLVP